MLQNAPYSPRSINSCRCHAPCQARVGPGRWLWVHAPTATGAFAFLQEPLKLEESNAFLDCTWEANAVVPLGAGFLTRSVSYRYQALFVPSTGIPTNCIVIVNVRYDEFPTLFVWESESILPLNDQWNCRETFDLDPLPDGQDSHGLFPDLTGINGTLWTKWGGGVSPF